MCGLLAMLLIGVLAANRAQYAAITETKLDPKQVGAVLEGVIR